jgi:hypothetical protein
MARLYEVDGDAAMYWPQGGDFFCDRLDHLPGDLTVPSFGPRMVCTTCGTIGVDARPNWGPPPIPVPTCGLSPNQSHHHAVGIGRSVMGKDCALPSSLR